MYSKKELKKWIRDVRQDVLDSDGNYMFYLITPETVEDILVLLDEFEKLLKQKGKKENDVSRSI